MGAEPRESLSVFICVQAGCKAEIDLFFMNPNMAFSINA